MNIHYYYLVLREEEKSAKLWFGTRYGAFEEIKEGIPPSVINIPELQVINFFLFLLFFTF